LLVSALNHANPASEVGSALLNEFVRHVASGPLPKRALKPESVRRMHEKLQEKTLDLTKETWRFKPDPKNSGVAENWHKPELRLDDSWSTIRVGKHWEAQGWPNLDGWAWYRIDVTIPKDWNDQKACLSFEGVDDHYEAFVNGMKVGSGGDPISKRTAFEERASHDISKAVRAGERCCIAVRVLDWYGAGGIHRPVRLSTSKLGSGGEMLR
jgi:beta-galactosidase/beta-glucuronidase